MKTKSHENETVGGYEESQFRQVFPEYVCTACSLFSCGERLCVSDRATRRGHLTRTPDFRANTSCAAPSPSSKPIHSARLLRSRLGPSCPKARSDRGWASTDQSARSWCRCPPECRSSTPPLRLRHSGRDAGPTPHGAQR